VGKLREARVDFRRARHADWAHLVVVGRVAHQGREQIELRVDQFLGGLDVERVGRGRRFGPD